MSRLFTPQTLGGHLKRLSLSRGMEAIIHESARAILADYAVHASRLSSLHVHVTISTRPYRLIVALRSGSSSGQKDSFFFFTFSLFLFLLSFFFASNFSAQEARKLLQRALDVVPFVPCHPSSPSHHPRLLAAPPTSSTLAVVALHSLRPATIESRSTSREQFKARIIIKSS